MARAVFQVGDIIRNRITRLEGRILRVYGDLDTSRRGRKRLVYIVAVANREELWQESDVEPAAPADPSGGELTSTAKRPGTSNPSSDEFLRRVKVR